MSITRKPEDKTCLTMSFPNGFFVECMKHGKYWEYWLCHEQCGIKSLSFGVDRVDEDFFNQAYCEYYKDYANDFIDFPVQGLNC